MRTPSLPEAWELNVARADRPARLGPGELAAAAQEALPAASAPQLELGPDHGALAEAVADRGWMLTRLVVMALRGPISPAAPPGAVATVPLEAVAPAFDRYLRSEPWGGAPALRAQLQEALRRLDAAAEGRLFAVREGGDVVAWCRLWLGDGIAQVDDVVTLPDARRTGRARAVVSAAAGAASADLVFLVADADDWPRDFYARLGFEPIGVLHRLRRTV